jgi:hypothetical protein
MAGRKITGLEIRFLDVHPHFCVFQLAVPKFISAAASSHTFMKRLLTIFLLSTAAVMAEGELTASHLKAATDLTTTVGADKQMESSFQNLVPMINSVALRLQLSQPDAAELKSIYKSWFTEDLDHAKLLSQLVKSYAEIYTEEELVELNKFYQTELGKKTLTTNQELMRKSTAAGMEEAKAKQELLQKRLQPFIEKHQPPGGTAAPAAVPTPAPEPQPEPAPEPAPDKD